MENDTHQRTRAIKIAIRAEEERLRTRFTWLAHQDLLGLGCFVACLLAMAGVTWLYLAGILAWWIVIPLMALPLSILHEIEHDLIHHIYFKHRAWIQNSMMFVIWVCKLNLNPWYRREIHLRHHRESGQTTDVEERLLGIGLPFGLLRLFVTLHPVGGLVLLPRIRRDAPNMGAMRLFWLSLPTFSVAFWVWEGFFGYMRLRSGLTIPFDPANSLPAWAWPYVRDLAVLIVIPNMLRQSSLAAISSYCHYYEDIPTADVFYQTQILRSWLLVPFQLFCFNFGTTHIIHHYVATQPFYLRQMVAPVAVAELVNQGTRVDDFGIVARANRWG